MLSGRHAFRGDSAAETMSAILREEPPDLSATNQGVSPGLDRIVRRCIEKSPEQRFHSAHDVAFALEDISGLSSPSLVSPSLSVRGRIPKLATVAAPRRSRRVSSPAGRSGAEILPLPRRSRG
jgi:serine/threonine protein kinase